jgi:hypothetical protein
MFSVTQRKRQQRKLQWHRRLWISNVRCHRPYIRSVFAHFCSHRYRLVFGKYMRKFPALLCNQTCAVQHDIPEPKAIYSLSVGNNPGHIQGNISMLNRLLLLAAVLGVQTTAMAANGETVVTGAQYADQVYYHMEDGSVKTVVNNNWDIAFQISGYSSAILTNGAAGVLLYDVPGSTGESWSDPVDTTGMAAGWNSWHNSVATWDQGAFNMDRDYNTGDFGWGEYNMLTHTVSGSRVFVIRLTDGSYKKIIIDGLIGGSYSFRYADLDGSNEMSGTLVKKEFTGKNFGYYSLSNGSSLDREPQSSEWHLSFNKYMDLVTSQNGPTPYAVTGIRLNTGVLAAKVISTTPETAPAPEASLFTSKITEIGWDWKTYDFASNSYKINDTTAYFVMTPDDQVYRLIFTGFSGSGTGTYTFNTSLVTTTDIRETENGTDVFGVYPNTLSAGETMQIVISSKQALQPTSIGIYDMTGREMFTSNLPAVDSGFYQYPVSTSSLSSGMYLVVLHIDGRTVSQPVIVR